MTKKHYTLRERLQYWFDNAMAKGVGAQIALLGLASLVLIAVVALFVTLFRLFPAGMTTLEYPEAFWVSLVRTLDPGTMGQDAGPGFRAAMLVVTVGGIIIVASLISVIANDFNTRIDNLRKGRSRVLETGHIVILGWNSTAIAIISELCLAHESEKKSTIVILSQRDKVELEDELAHKIKHHGKTKFIVRTGDPMSLFDIDIVSPKEARSIIVLASDDSDDADSEVLRTTLAVLNNPHRKSENYNIVAEITKPEHIEAAEMVGRHEAHWIISEELISRITVQASRQSGLSVVFTELLDFEGDELYFASVPELVGKTFLEAQLSFEKSAALGLHSPRRMVLNPAASTVIAADDELILVAEDDSAIHYTPAVKPAKKLNVSKTNASKSAEHTLILGYNTQLDVILAEIDAHSVKGSRVSVIAECESIPLARYKNIKVSFQQGDTTVGRVLDAVRLADFQHVIVLAYSDTLNAHQADAKTLITLLHLRERAAKAKTKLNIVTEMMDDKNRQLAEVTNADDFIVSDKLVALLMAQLSENPELSRIFDVLFRSEGTEITLHPAEYYVPLGKEVDFYTVIQSASGRGESAFGYRHHSLAHSSDDGYGVHVNPAKSQPITFQAGDAIIVLSKA